MNTITPEVAEKNASIEGAYTFNFFPPENYAGPVFIFAVCGLGDHAHIELCTGMQVVNGYTEPRIWMSHAGNMVMAWRDWEMFRDILMGCSAIMRIAEVRRATTAQLHYHEGQYTSKDLL